MQTALITGGSGMIGQAVATALAESEYNVAVNFHNNRAALELESDRITAVQADITQPDQVKRMIEQIEQKFGKIDLLVNNAGVAQQKLFLDITSEEWKTMMDVHVTGTFNCCKAVLPYMVHRKSGSIINISSMWGQVGGSCEVHYSTAKAAVIGMTKALAKEMGLSGIRVNCVAPGFIDTPMNGGLDDGAKQEIKESTPLNRLGTPKDVANAVCFLASPNSSFITGQVIAPNGGLVI